MITVLKHLRDKQVRAYSTKPGDTFLDEDNVLWLVYWTNWAVTLQNAPIQQRQLGEFTKPVTPVDIQIEVQWRTN